MTQVEIPVVRGCDVVAPHVCGDVTPPGPDACVACGRPRGEWTGLVVRGRDAHPAERRGQAPRKTRRVRRHEPKCHECGAHLVTLPARGFAEHRLQRVTLTGRHMSPMRPGPVVAARMAWATREPARVEISVVSEAETYTWQEERVVERTLDMRWALVSLAIVIAVVWCALRVAGISVL